MAGNVAGVGRHYVSQRLTRETGVTMRVLRSCNWLHVRRRLIAAGELDDRWLPTHWSPQWCAQVVAVWDRLEPARPP